MSKQAEAKRDSVIHPQNDNFNQISTQKNLDALETLRINQSRPQNLATYVPSGTIWSTSSDTHQVVEIKKRDFYWDVNTILNQI